MGTAIKINFRVLCFCLMEFVHQTSSNADYISCVEKGLVVSEVFCLPSDYRADVPPPMPKGSPVPVYLKLPVTEISKIDDQRSQISLRLTYKLQWPEPRMILNTSADWSMGEINVRGDMVDHFWTPDIIIHDLVSFYKPEVLNQVAALEIKANKFLYYKVRSDLTTVCKGMKFHRFPLDEHVCYLQLTSFGYNDKEMVLDGQFSYEFFNQRALPFNVEIREIAKENRIYQGSNSNYSVYGLSIHLTRCVSPYLLNVYLPTAIFVVMSWVSFLIPTDVVPARIVLLVTLCLVIINTFNNVTARIPVASQVTALEIWLLACILLVFGALAEYAFILRQIIRLSRHQRRREEEMSLASPAIAAASTMAAMANLGRGNNQSPTLAFKLNGGGMMEVVNGHEQQEQQVRTDLQEQVLLLQHQQQRRRQQLQLQRGPSSEACLGAPHGLHHRHQHLVHMSQSSYNNDHDDRMQRRRQLQDNVAESQQLQHDFHRSMIILDSMSPTGGDPDFGSGGGESMALSNMPPSSPPSAATETTATATARSPTLPTSSSPPPHFMQSCPAQMVMSGDGVIVVGCDDGVGGGCSIVKPDKRSAELLMRRYQEQVDGKALVLFPLSFLLFNIGYWSHYLLNLEQYF